MHDAIVRKVLILVECGRHSGAKSQCLPACEYTIWQCCRNIGNALG